MRRLLLPVLATALAAPALIACSADNAETDKGPPLPAESSFIEGTCRTAAPDILAVGRDIPRFDETGDSGADGSLPQEVRDSLRDAQERLFALAETAEPQYKSALDVFVVQIGAVRIRADGNEYTPDIGAQLTKDYQAVLDACTDTAG